MGKKRVRKNNNNAKKKNQNNMNTMGVQEKNNKIIIKNKDENKDRKVEMYISQLTKEATKLGGIIYDLAYTGHTFAVINDGKIQS